MTITITLPRTYALDALDRFPPRPDIDGTIYECDEVTESGKRVTLRVNAAGLDWLKEDAAHYADGHADAAPPDIVASAKRARVALAKVSP